MNAMTKDGKIRTRKICPFLSKCSMRNSNCPQRGNVKPLQHSCGTARLFAIARPVKQVETIEEPTMFNIVEAVEAKKAERYAGRNWVDLNIGDRLYAK